MKGDKKGMGVLIGLGPSPEGEEYEDEMPADDDMREAKVTAWNALLSAIKGNDPEGAADAYDALRECY